MPLPTFWCHPDAPEPLCAETPDWLEPGQTYRLRQIPETGEGSNVQIFSWLCFIGAYQFTKQGYNHPLQKIPPRQPVSRSLGLAVQKLEREREVNVAKAPTQSVMQCREYKTLMTLVHTWYSNPYLLVPPRRSGATLRRNPGLAGARTHLSSTADTRTRRG